MIMQQDFDQKTDTLTLFTTPVQEIGSLLPKQMPFTLGGFSGIDEFIEVLTRYFIKSKEEGGSDLLRGDLPAD